jgi:pyruvate/2-oxoglutarate dehydrogenase complex dihydrolipoamide dehydrogenase (E3) component
LNDHPAESRADDKYVVARLANVHPPNWVNPSADKVYDLVVLGAGPGGLTAAREARRLGARVAIVESGAIGGDRLNEGSVPSKALIRTSRAYADMRAAEQFGARSPANVQVDLPFALERMRRVQDRLSRLENARRLTDAGIDVFFGRGAFSGPDALVVSGKALRFEACVIATGSRPAAPDIDGLAAARYLTNESIFDRADLPRRLLLIGGGPLGCELAQTFVRLDVSVAIVERDPMFLSGEDRDAAQILAAALARDGVEIHLNTDILSVAAGAHGKTATLLSAGQTSTVTADEIVVGAGRTPNVESIGLDEAGVAYRDGAGVGVDDWLRTSNPKVFAVGDVCLDKKFAHSAEASARLAVHNALLGADRRLSALIIPWCTYTDPEIAHVGLFVREARERSIPVKTYTVLMQDVDRAVTDGEDEGFVKVHVEEGGDRILGATMVARHAGEMINALSLAIKCEIGLRRVADVIHAYPTVADAVKMAADACARELSGDGLASDFKARRRAGEMA